MGGRTNLSWGGKKVEPSRVQKSAMISRAGHDYQRWWLLV
jgi:hypothetical protein